MPPFEETGAGEPAFVLVPGWCCDRSLFGPLVEHFGARHRVVAIDLPHGAGIPALADDVALLCVELGIDRPLVIGHSMGGMVGVELAARHPSLPLAIVALDPGPLHATSEATQMYTAFANQLVGPDGEAVRRAYVEDATRGTVDTEWKRRIIETMCSVPLEQAAAGIRAVVDWNGVGALAMCRVPLLVLRARTGGSNDPARLLAIKPDTQIAVTVGAGHFNHLDVPEQVYPMLERFLELAG